MEAKLDWDEFRAWSHRAADWGADYRASLRDRPVRANTAAGRIAAQIAPSPPESGRADGGDLRRFRRDHRAGHDALAASALLRLLSRPTPRRPRSSPNIWSTRWRAQCMLWQTSPAATELETQDDRLAAPGARAAGRLLRRDPGFGLVGDARRRADDARAGARLGRQQAGPRRRSRAVRIYCSAEVHTSIDRAIWVAGIGEDNLVASRSRRAARHRCRRARSAIVGDRAAGLLPAGIIASVGGTSVGGTDDVADDLPRSPSEHGLYVHVDAAWAGSAMICPEFRHYWAGVERRRLHRLQSAQMARRAVRLLGPFHARSRRAWCGRWPSRPEYLKTHGHDGIINYSEWTVPLGRRFRALKLWFLLRAHGLEGLRTMIRNHVAWSRKAGERLDARARTSRSSPSRCCRCSRSATAPAGAAISTRTILRLVNAINDDGRIYLTQTRVDGRVAIRFQAGQFETDRGATSIPLST